MGVDLPAAGTTAPATVRGMWAYVFHHMLPRRNKEWFWSPVGRLVIPVKPLKP